MAWPTANINTTNLDASSDSPASARADLLGAVQAVNNMMNARNAAEGIPSLGADSQVPTAQGGMPTGSMIAYAGATAPTGWLFCAGQAVNRVTYAALFAAIGTAWGVGDGSTTFNVPDFRDRVPVGKGDMGGSHANRMGATLSGTTTAGGAVITGLSSTAGLAVGMLAIGANIPAGRTIASINSATQITLNSGTGVTAGTASIRFAVVDTGTLGAAGGSATHTLTTAQIPSHSHGGNTGSGGSHSHTVSGATNAYSQPAEFGSETLASASSQTTSTAAAHTHTITAEGGGQAHPTIQPSGVCNFIIKT